mmetsp:Transcript_51146/g.121554  ORF Transcript_51146/g.121554 Transcript_51146/m.121554 type:complete len:253 (+) Transcript_51146:88-846(+)
MPKAIEPETAAMGAMVLAGVFVGLAILSFIAVYMRRKPLPGKLLEKGTFEHEDPTREEDIEERKRDFSRIAATQRDLWIFSPTQLEAQVTLPTPPSGGDVVAEEAVERAVSKLKEWLESNLKGVEDTSALMGRVLATLSVTPGFDFVMRHKVPPMIMQGKYILMVSRKGQVRLAWYAFVTDSPKPNAVAGPFIVKMVSEDLASAERSKRSYTQYHYTARSTSSEDMNKVVSRHLKHIVTGIECDSWEPFLTL